MENKRTETKQATTESKETAAQATPRAERQRRSAFNGTRGKLQVGHSIPGYHLHILNDTPGRIQQAQESGYEFVSPEEVGGVTNNVTSRNTDIGDKVRFLVGTTDGGEPLYAYLMKIKQEWYDEDQKELQRRNEQIDAAIRGGKLTGDGMSTEGFYNAGIKYGK